MEAAIQTVVKVFMKQTKGKESLGKKEFQNLVSSQLSNILTDADSKEAVDNMGQGLDSDKDGKVGFEEYMKLVGYLACSLSEQRSLAKEEPAKNDASGQVAQSAPKKEEEKPEANAEAKENTQPEENVEPTKAAEAKVEAKANTKVEVGVKAEGGSKLEEAKEEAAAATVDVVVAAAVEEVKKEAEKGEATIKVEEGAEKLPASVEEEVEKKTDEATS